MCHKNNPIHPATTTIRHNTLNSIWIANNFCFTGRGSYIIIRKVKMVTRSSENSTRFLLGGLSNMCGGAGESFNFDLLKLTWMFYLPTELANKLKLTQNRSKVTVVGQWLGYVLGTLGNFFFFLWRVSFIPHLYPYPRVQVKTTWKLFIIVLR